MIKNRIKELRRERNLSQESLGGILGTTQQTISKMENEKYEIPTDLLIALSKYFNVTTDYILGISEIKRNFECQLGVNKEMIFNKRRVTHRNKR